MKLEQGERSLLIDGRPLEGCEEPADGDPFAFQLMPDGGLYCFSAATDVEVWVISQRLSGKVPTQEEIAAQESQMQP